MGRDGGHAPSVQEACQPAARMRVTGMHYAWAVTVSFTQASFLSLAAGGFHRIAYLDWGTPSSEHIVVCVHGLARNSRDFDFLARTLAEECRVVCPDVAG